MLIDRIFMKKIGFFMSERPNFLSRQPFFHLLDGSRTKSAFSKNDISCTARFEVNKQFETNFVGFITISNVWQ